MSKKKPKPSLMHVAVYKVPFLDFDYENIVKACGATLIDQQGNALVIKGSLKAINTLSMDLDWGPVIII